jgi:hypothetical protein
VVSETKEKAVLIDWKFGRLEPDVTNLRYQMMAYALALLQMPNFQDDFEAVEVWVYAPRIGKEWRGLFGKGYEMDQEAIEAALRETIRRCEADELVFSAGPHCKHCRASVNCVTAHRWMREESGEMALSNYERTELTPHQLSRGIEFAKFIGPWAKQFNTWAKSLADATLAAAGWQKKEIRGRRYLPDLLDAYGLLRRDYEGLILESDIWPLVTLPYGKLEKLFVEKLAQRDGLKKVEAKRHFEALMSAIVRRSNPSITLTKAGG